jgi:predicted  nucleic acid-binding Zn-ribbon protein
MRTMTFLTVNLFASSFVILRVYSWRSAMTASRDEASRGALGGPPPGPDGSRDVPRVLPLISDGHPLDLLNEVRLQLHHFDDRAVDVSARGDAGTIGVGEYINMVIGALNDATKRAFDSEGNIMVLVTEVMRLGNEIDKGTGYIAELEGAVEKCVELCEKLSTDGDEARAEITKLNETVAELTREKDGLTQDLEYARSEIAGLMRERDGLVAEIDDLKDRAMDLRPRIARLE